MVPSIESTIANLEEPLMPPTIVGESLSVLDGTERNSLADLLREVSSGLEALQSADKAARRTEIFGGE